MIRSLFRTIKHLVYAVLLLGTLLCGTEVGLRAYRYRELRSSRPDPVASTSFQLVQPSPRTFVELQPGASVFSWNPDSEQMVPLRTNSLGLRGGEVAIPKPAGVFRILCLGDETTLGAEIPEANLYSTRLREHLQESTQLRVEILNAGLPGGCPVIAALHLRHHLIGLQPDLVLLHFDMSDVADGHRVRRFVRMDEAGAPAMARHPLMDGMQQRRMPQFDDEFLLARWGKQKLGMLVDQEWLAQPPQDIDNPRGTYLWLRDESPDWSRDIEQCFSAVEYIHAICAGAYTQLIVSTCPKPWQVSERASDGPGVWEAAGVPRRGVLASDRPFRLLANFTTEQRIPFIDASPWFRQAESKPEDLYLHHAPSLSSEGHALYAAILEEFVLNNVPGVWDTSP